MLDKIRTPQEKWWNKHGGAAWKAEMESPARISQDHYKYQMVLIDRVFSKLVSTDVMSVLEVGCGYGRVISYLRDNFSSFDVYGCDQSEAMIKEAANCGFDKDRLSFGNVRSISNDLKYDIVYTSEMLIHIHPDDIQDSLSNLLDLATKYVVHIENSPIFGLFNKSSDEHNGCWEHNFIALYDYLGLKVKIINQEGTLHSGYVIKV